MITCARSKHVNACNCHECYEVRHSLSCALLRDYKEEPETVMCKQSRDFFRSSVDVKTDPESAGPLKWEPLPYRSWGIDDLMPDEDTTPPLPGIQASGD